MEEEVYHVCFLFQEIVSARDTVTSDQCQAGTKSCWSRPFFVRPGPGPSQVTLIEPPDHYSLASTISDGRPGCSSSYELVKCMIIVMHYIYIYYGYTTTPRVLLILESTKYAYFVAGAIFLRLCILCIPLSIKLFYHTALY